MSIALWKFLQKFFRISSHSSSRVYLLHVYRIGKYDRWLIIVIRSAHEIRPDERYIFQSYLVFAWHMHSLLNLRLWKTLLNWCIILGFKKFHACSCSDRWEVSTLLQQCYNSCYDLLSEQLGLIFRRFQEFPTIVYSNRMIVPQRRWSN